MVLLFFFSSGKCIIDRERRRGGDALSLGGRTRERDAERMGTNGRENVFGTENANHACFCCRKSTNACVRAWVCTIWSMDWFISDDEWVVDTACGFAGGFGVQIVGQRCSN